MYPCLKRKVLHVLGGYGIMDRHVLQGKLMHSRKFYGEKPKNHENVSKSQE
jgi:hypothetical protein